MKSRVKRVKENGGEHNVRQKPGGGEWKLQHKILKGGFSSIVNNTKTIRNLLLKVN